MSNKIIICHYCMNPAKLTNGKEIYPHRKDLHSKLFYRCDPCEAYVGCHPNSDKPLGRLSDEELRAAKSYAHKEFDPIWKYKIKTNRKEAYQWLAAKLGINPDDCHIGMFDVDMCYKTAQVSHDLLWNYK